MRQAVVVANHNVQVQEAEPPRPSPGDVLVRVRFGGICGSDVHIYEGLHPNVPRPIVIGHEAAGVVERSTTGAPAPGTPVAIVPLFSCGECPHCRFGEPWICYRREVMGFQRPGCLAELLAVPADKLLPLHPGQDPALAALFEPLAVAMHGAGLADPRPGDHAIVVGAGNVGLLLSLFLRDEVGARVSLIDVNPARVDLARELGFEATTQAADLDLSQDTARPIAFECVGRAESASTIFDLLPAPRVAVLVGTFPADATIGLLRLKRWETRVVGSQIYTIGELQRALDILSSPAADNYRKLVVPRQFELGQIHEALEAALNTQAGTKVVVRIDS